MGRNLEVVCIILGTFLVTQTSCNDTPSNNFQDFSTTSEYSDGILCELSAAKRMLKEMGIKSTKRCLLQNKRDIANLVSAYLNGDSSSGRKRTSYRNKLHENNRKESYKDSTSARNENINYNLDSLDRLLSKDVRTKSKRAGSGSYCCSPDCDVFMKNFSWPNPDIITCEA